MSDMPVVEIKSSQPGRGPASFADLVKEQKADQEQDAKNTKLVETEVETEKPAESEKPAKWVRTRQCWCPRDAATDCRFHSRKEPGWEVCPSKNSPNRTEGRWLWASIGQVASSEETEKQEPENTNEVTEEVTGTEEAEQ